MSGVLSLAPEFRAKPLAVGDLVRLEVLLDKKVGVDGEKWEIVPLAGVTPAAWIASGSLTLRAHPIRVLPSEGDTTKLEITGLVHQPGPLATTAFSVRRENGEQEEVAAATSLGSEVSAPPAPQEGQAKEQEPPWILPPVAFGGWNYLVIALLVALLLAVLGVAAWALWRRFGRRFRKTLDHQEKALAALQDLQKYGRSKVGIQQEEWKRFSFELAGTLRRYADTNFKIKSLDMTDREFLAALRDTPKGPEQVEALSKILETIDAVRYGRKDLSTSVVGELLQDSRRYIKNTFVPLEDQPAGKKA